jgi:hypothetical protein
MWFKKFKEFTNGPLAWLSNWATLLTLLGGWSGLGWAATYWDAVYQQGWVAVFFVSLGGVCAVIVAFSLLILATIAALNRFNPKPVANGAGTIPLTVTDDGGIGNGMPNENGIDVRDVIRAPEQTHALDIGEFGRVSFQTIFQPSPWPNDVQGNREFVAVAVRFTFKVTIDRPKIRITSTRRRNVRSELDPSLVDEHAWYAKIEDRIWHERDTVDIAIAFVGRDIHNHGFTGDWATPPKIVQNNQYLFLVEILSDKPIKALQLYMSVPSIADGPQLSRPDIYNGNLFYLQDERHSPFSDGRFDLSANDVPVSKPAPPWVDHPAYQGMFAKDHPA